MTALEEIKKALEGVTPGPWKAVSDAHFDSGLVYTSVQPVNVDEEAMKPLAMANGEYHVCRMSHSAAPWRFNYHRKNARYIAAANPAAISELLSTLESLQRENAILQERTADYPTISAKLHDREKARDAEQISCREAIARAEAAEAEVKRLKAERLYIMGFNDGWEAANEEGKCPVCAEPFKPEDMCATDIEMGVCHAICLEGCQVVDLRTGEPSDIPVDTYRYDSLWEPSDARTALASTGGEHNGN